MAAAVVLCCSSHRSVRTTQTTTMSHGKCCRIHPTVMTSHHLITTRLLLEKETKSLRRHHYAIDEVDCVWNVMAHAQKPDFVFRRNGRVHLSRRGRQFSRLLAAEVCASAVVMLDTPCSEVVWRVVATHSIRQFLLHFPSRASPCAITFELDSTLLWIR